MLVSIRKPVPLYLRVQDEVPPFSEVEDHPELDGRESVTK